MNGTPIGRRGGVLETHWLVLHPDRLEQVSGSVFGLEVRRLFFDELTCATLQRQFAPWVELGVGGLLAVAGLASVGFGVGLRSWPLGALGAVLLATFVSLLVAAWRQPPWLLVVHAGEQSFRTLLPRRAALRERRLALLLRAVEAHQRQRGGSPPAGL